ncbi:hypothetical protein OH77DRAFT_1046111 [Trametes cingulata]|nr:hypothetical protein OH77DRAFT_1046111 [Trametes cingulata]
MRSVCGTTRAFDRKRRPGRRRGTEGRKPYASRVKRFATYRPSGPSHAVGGLTVRIDFEGSEALRGARSTLKRRKRHFQISEESVGEQVRCTLSLTTLEVTAHHAPFSRSPYHRVWRSSMHSPCPTPARRQSYMCTGRRTHHCATSDACGRRLSCTYLSRGRR